MSISVNYSSCQIQNMKSKYTVVHKIWQKYQHHHLELQVACVVNDDL